MYAEDIKSKGVKSDVRQARATDINHISSILTEAAEWLTSINQQLWQGDEIALSNIREDVFSGLYYIAWQDENPVGTFKFQLEDTLFWPDVLVGESAFIHRLAVKRNVAGSGVSAEMINWAKRKTKELGRTYLRLDSVPRPKLCSFYERNGFTKHSERQVGPYYVFRYELKVSD